MFCASCSSTPQLTTGGFRPTPRKESEVSATIIVGTARVTMARIWLVSDGRIWRKISRASLEPSSRAAVTKSSSRNARNRPRTSRARLVQPSSETISVMTK
jgi:hypothetical protein